MTYVYTKPAALPQVDAATVQRTAKMGFAALAAAAMITAAFIAVSPKSKPAPLATQPVAFELAPAQPQAQAGLKVPELMTYRGIDNAIRDVQMDNARLGHKMKLAIKSERNPIKRTYNALSQKYSLMAILVGLAFVFTLFSLGLVRTSRGDLENY